MRHGKKFNHLGRKVGHRRALLKNMACSLIEHKRIVTTLAKAKALRVHIEPLITKAKTNSTHSRRVVFSYLQRKEAIMELFGPIAQEIGDRPGGYLRIVKTGHRKGDGAEMAMIEFVDFNKDYIVGEGSGSKSKTRRSRRGGKKSTTETAAAATAVIEEVNDVAEDVVDNVEDSVDEIIDDTIDSAKDTTEE